MHDPKTTFQSIGSWSRGRDKHNYNIEQAVEANGLPFSLPKNFALICVFKSLRICLRRASVACRRNSSPTKGLLEAEKWFEPARVPFFLGDRIFFLLASSLKSLSATFWRCFVDSASCCLKSMTTKATKIDLTFSLQMVHSVRCMHAVVCEVHGNAL